MFVTLELSLSMIMTVYFFCSCIFRGDLKVSECVTDMAAYLNLTDCIFRQIRVSKNKKLRKSQDLLKALEKRKLFPCLAESCPVGNTDCPVSMFMPLYISTEGFKHACKKCSQQTSCPGMCVFLSLCMFACMNALKVQ